MEDLIKMYRAIIFSLEYSAQLTDTINEIEIAELIKLMEGNIDRLESGRKWWDMPIKNKGDK